MLVIFRDITQLNAPGCVVFSADTPIAERWMRKQYGVSRMTFLLPAQYGAAVSFKEAAEAQSLSIIALKKRFADMR